MPLAVTICCCLARGVLPVSVYLESNDMFEMSALKIDDDTFYISQFESFTEVCPPLARDVELGGGGDTGAVVNDVCLDMTGRCRVACTVTGLRRGQTERGAVLSWSIL